MTFGKYFTLVLFFIYANFYFSQNEEELKQKIKDSQGLQKAQYEIQLSNKLTASNPSEAFDFAKSALENGEGNDKIMGAAFALMAQSSLKLKKYENVVKYGLDASKLFESSDKNNYAMSASIIADGYNGLHKTDDAIIYYEKSYNTYLSISKPKNAGFQASSIGMLYNNNKAYKKAISWYEKAYTQFGISGNQKDEVQSLHTIGAIYSNYGDYKNAIETLEKAIQLAQKYGLSNNVSNIKSDLEKVELNKSSDNNTTSFKEEQIKEQEDYINKVKNEQSKTLAQIELMSEEMQLAELKIKAAQDEASLALLQKNAALDKAKLAEIEAESAKLIVKSAQDEKDKLNAEKEAAMAKSQILWIAVASIGLVAILILIGLIRKRKSNQLLITKNEEINLQKDELTKQASNIQESIDYATRIQKAMLPSPSEFMSMMPGSFVFLRPKDSVSGDFFWYHKAGNQIIIIAADCTGHGVPGAFMSIIFSNLLDKVIIDEKITHPNQILESICGILTSKLMERNLKYENFKDGMDVSVVNINTTTKRLMFSGARNGIYIVRNGNLSEIKGTKRYVGVLNEQVKLPFENHDISIEKDDFIYLFSDGFADQKGGEKGKKFYYQPFKDLVVTLSDLNGNQIPEKLNAKYEQWKGNQKQFDDVLVVGVRIT